MEESGLATIADLQALSDATAGGALRQVRAPARAASPTATTTAPSRRYRPIKSISAETTFRQDTGSGAELLRDGARLVRAGRGASSPARAGRRHRVVLKLKTSDFRILTRSRRLTHPTQRADVLLRERDGADRAGGRRPHVPADRRRRGRSGPSQRGRPRRPVRLRRQRGRLMSGRTDIACIVLAAGRSTRMGAANKLLGRRRRQADGAAAWSRRRWRARRGRCWW